METPRAVDDGSRPSGSPLRSTTWFDTLRRGAIPGVAVPKAFVQRYEKLDPSKRVAAIVDEVVGGDVGDRERKIEVPKSLHEVHTRCREIYEALYQHRLH